MVRCCPLYGLLYVAIPECKRADRGNWSADDRMVCHSGHSFWTQIQHTTSCMALHLLTRPGKPVFHSVSELTGAFWALLNF